MPALPSPPVQSSRRMVVGCAVLLVLTALAAYHNSFRVPFLLDDTFAISDNATIRHLGDLKQVLLPNVGYGITVSGRPVLNLSLALCYAVSGNSVWSYHAFNLIIHVLAGLTLFGIARRTFLFLPAGGGRLPRAMGAGAGDAAGISGRLPATTRSTFLAFAIALLWTVHPLQTEAVTYIIQRTESLMGLFFLLTLYCFIRAVASQHRLRWRVLSVLACLAAVGTKEVAATAPLLVFLYDRTFVAGTFREAWSRRRWFHLSLAATWVPLAVLVGSTGWNRGGTVGLGVGVSPWAYWLTQFEAITRYLRQAAWPHPLVFEYGTFFASPRDAAPFALLVVPLVAAAIVALWRWPIAGFLGAWFFVILSPTSLVPGTIQMIVEHRMYLPLAAVVAAAVVGLDVAMRRRPETGAQLSSRRTWDGLSLPVIGCVALAVPLGRMTELRNALYADPVAFWQQTVDESPASAIAQSSLGTALYQRNRVREAIQPYLISLQLDPKDVSTHYNLGLAYAALGDLSPAIAQYEEALRINPQFYSAHYQLGLALLQLNRPPEALISLAEAARLAPNMAEARYEWGVALARTGRLADAVQQYEAALRLKPGLIAAECDLGSAFLELNRVPDAVGCFQRAIRSDPNLADAHFNLGLALMRMGSTAEATTQYAEAVRLDPTNGKAQYNLGLALGQAGRIVDAIAHLAKAAQLEPGFAEAHFNLGVALAHAGRLSEAVDQYEAALRLRPDDVGAHQGLGIALLQLRRVTEARQQFEAALRIDRQFEPARAMLERLRNVAPGD